MTSPDRREALAAFERLAAVAKLLPDATYEDYALVKSALAADPPALDVERLARALQAVWWAGDGIAAEHAVRIATEYARLTREETLTVDRSRPCLLDPQCCRYQGHDGKHLYPETTR